MQGGLGFQRDSRSFHTGFGALVMAKQMVAFEYHRVAQTKYTFERQKRQATGIAERPNYAAFLSEEYYGRLAIMVAHLT